MYSLKVAPAGLDRSSERPGIGNAARRPRVGVAGVGGDEGTRTPYLSDANAALSQMSYVPVITTNRPNRMERPAEGSTFLRQDRWDDPRPMR